MKTPTNCKLCSYSFTQASQACQIYVSHTGHNFCLLPTAQAISADICFCIDIPKLTSIFPQTEKAMAMCLRDDFPRYLCFRCCLQHLNTVRAHTFHTYVQAFVPSLDGHRLKNTRLLCAGLLSGQAASLLLVLCNMC